ncbi:MAG: MG2 domain-containing protein [Myxococcota bacterium]
MRWSPLVLVLALGCALRPQAADSLELPHDPLAHEAAPPASKRVLAEIAGDVGGALDQKVRTWFDHNGARRLHVQLDRPMYRPGDDIWLRSWSVLTRSFDGDPAYQITAELVDPRGQTVETRVVAQESGFGIGDFTLAPDAAGGTWKVRLTSMQGDTLERDFVVASYRAPTIHKELDFVREAYGAGDRVEAVVEMKGPDGGALANHPVRAMLQLDGETVWSEELSTDRTGAVLVAASLPKTLASGDGLLTVLVDEGGVTESISRSVPIVLADVKMAFYPEGGDLVQGLPGRVYFEGKDRWGKPADLQGVVKDDQGTTVATFSSVHDGLGRFAFTPVKGRRYTAHITAPAGVAETFALPDAVKDGCALRSYDDLNSTEKAVRVAVRCTTDQDVVVTGVLREQTVDTAVVKAGPAREAVVYLTGESADAKRQGAMRVTVMDRQYNPLAERLVYRNRGQDLKIAITTDREQYGPRDEVVVKVKTTDPSGEPVPAALALSVVDDAVLSLADDEEGHILSRLYLDPELVESPEDPAWYFDPDEADGARGLDLVMGTKGWRRFEWAPVLTFDPVQQLQSVAMADTGMYYGLEEERSEADDFADAPQRDRRLRPRPAKVPMAPPMMAPVPMAPPPMGPPMGMPQAIEMPMAEPVMPADMGLARREMQRKDMRGLGGAAAGRKALGAEVWMRDDFRQAVPMAPVRVFPKPDYSAGFTGVRSDFRDTVDWEPMIQTNAEGVGEATFFLSDALTRFRVTAEGVASGAAGHGEATFTSVLPVSLSTRLPVAVSAGDRIDLPITVKNTRERGLDVKVHGEMAALLKAERADGSLSVAAHGTSTYWMPITIQNGTDGPSGTATPVRLTVEGGGLQDTLETELTVVPLGFPRSWSAAGELERTAKHTFQLDEHVPGSLTATVTWHPSTVSTLIGGMEGLIREPGGCFEQTSSTNWPNVAILNYLEAHEGDPRLKVQSSRALQVGYDKLTGYQVDSGGFETFGSGPGKEVLSAFGLLQFSDMQKVFPVADRVLEKDTKYLLSTRDGKGGYTNSGESAHGYGSAPKPVLDGFITWALVSVGLGDELKTELAHQARVAQESKDPYVLALAARSLVATQHPMAGKALERLASLQAEDGSFPGAESSITRSYEANLLVESTALAALALMDAGPGHTRQADKAAAWLVEHRQGAGTWGATQATALALGALTKHAEVSRRPRSAGYLTVEVNGEKIGNVRYEPDQEAAIEITGLERALKRGENTVVLRHDGGDPLPYTVDVRWSSESPDSAPGAELSIDTKLDRTVAKMGETVRLTATVRNQTGSVVPSPIARIGLPAGLEAQTWQLQQLQERGQIAFFETRPREVTIYWEGVHAKKAHTVELDLTAAIPGSFTGPASSAYPYYDDDEKAWDGGLAVEVKRGS